MKERVFINSKEVPAAIGAYSQAVKCGDIVWLSGQIPLDPTSMTVVGDNVSEKGVRVQVNQVFKNLKNLCVASGGSLNDIVKINIFLLDMKYFPIINEVMAEFFIKPYPARAAVGVSSLPKGVCVEAEATMVLGT